MSNKQTIRRDIRWLTQVKTWQLLLLLLLSLYVSATFLRLNNVGMMERREAVLNADKTADVENIQTRLYDLQRYAAAHMNATTGDIYLDKTYERDTKRILEAAAAENSSDNSVLAKAVASCKERFYGWSRAYVQCVADEQAKFPAGDDQITQANFPKPALYKHSFVSPIWSPDFAGWSVLITIGIALVILVRLLTLGILRLLLRREYRRV